MELDELKKSWNALNEHLKDKELVKNEDITKLIAHANKNVNELSRFNKKLRILSLFIIAFILFVFIYDGVSPTVYYQITLWAVVPALGWDLFTGRFLSQTKVDEMSPVTVISRLNRIHRWVICERIIGIGFMVLMAGFSFVGQKVWLNGTGMIIFFLTLWAAGFSIFLWVYQKNLKHLRDIKKNLDEIKELKNED